MRLSSLVNDGAKDSNPTMLYNLTHEHQQCRKRSNSGITEHDAWLLRECFAIVGRLIKAQKTPETLGWNFARARDAMRQ
jgi:hypothetical protein